MRKVPGHFNLDIVPPKPTAFRKALKELNHPILNEFLPIFDKIREQAKGKRFRRNLKIECLSHYSGGKPICSCCGEEEIAFLELDHEDNNGAEHKRNLPHKGAGGLSVQLWVKKHRFPKGFAVLCSNCNKAKYTQGVCPHKTRPKRRAR